MRTPGLDKEALAPYSHINDPTHCLPSSETVELFCELGGRHSEVFQGELLGGPRTPGRVGPPCDLSL